MLLVLLALALPLAAADYAAPAGTGRAARRPGAESVLPGGRLITPLGRQYPTGPGPFGLAVSPSGELVVSADGGPNRFSLTVVRREGRYWRTRRLVGHIPRGLRIASVRWNRQIDRLARDAR